MAQGHHHGVDERGVGLDGGVRGRPAGARARSTAADSAQCRSATPSGDPGREDEFIKPEWPSTGTPMSTGSRATTSGCSMGSRSARREYDEPPAHLYELWNRGLAQGTRALGREITLDGCGGDQLFQVSDVILADLLRTGRWFESGESRAAVAAGGGWRSPGARWGSCHCCPPTGRSAGRACTGSPVFPRHYMERPLSRPGYDRSSWPSSGSGSVISPSFSDAGFEPRAH